MVTLFISIGNKNVKKEILLAEVSKIIENIVV